MKRLAVDIGGTFTDLVTLDETSGEVAVAKAPTTPHRFEDGVLATIDHVDLDAVSFLAHGTTVIFNALTERKGARTALVTRRGFRDVLEIQKANRPDLYDLLYEKPRAFVPRRLRLEVTERVDYRGVELIPLDEDDVRAAVAEAQRHGVEALAICFLHSYANPEHERRAAEIVRDEWPEVAVTVSHELSSEWREYERTSTAVLDAYVKPVTSRYLGALASQLAQAGIGAGRNEVRIFHADGRELVLGKCARYRLERGELARLVTGTGGGWGDPRERSLDDVPADVRDGYVSVEQAARDYGVVLDTDTLELVDST